jgi:hypothetical protein
MAVKAETTVFKPMAAGSLQLAAAAAKGAVLKCLAAETPAQAVAVLVDTVEMAAWGLLAAALAETEQAVLAAAVLAAIAIMKTQYNIPLRVVAEGA